MALNAPNQFIIVNDTTATILVNAYLGKSNLAFFTLDNTKQRSYSSATLQLRIRQRQLITKCTLALS